MSDHVQISTTAEERADAERIARTLVEEKLASCVQIIGPVKSIYRWKGRVEESEEWMCIIKTRKALYTDVERRIIHMHPYELPEIVAVPIEDGHEEYLAWMYDETASEEDLKGD